MLSVFDFVVLSYHAVLQSDSGASVKDAFSASIFDLFLVRFWGLKLATNATTTVLRVDQVRTKCLFVFVSDSLFFLVQIIMAKTAGGPKPREGKSRDDDD